jgi:hypothetical protein
MDLRYKRTILAKILEYMVMVDLLPEASLLFAAHPTHVESWLLPARGGLERSCVCRSPMPSMLDVVLDLQPVS